MATDDDPRKKINIGEVWNNVKINEQRLEPGVDDRPGWKTVRIFVSSTFKDFHQEREVLIKEVFQDLRNWCEQRKLHLIDCDLRWGVPKETTSELTLKTCLEEIDRCYENNRAPYFVNMTCKRVGWIPLEEELPKTLWDKYQLVFGLSVTEMEIVHAAYRIENPNALFLIRDDSFLDSIKDENVRKEFIDELKPTADQKLEVLKDKIKCRFPDNVVTYKCEYVEGERLYTDYTEGKGKGRPKLKLEKKFSETVLSFFMDRIEKQYPLVQTEANVYEDAKYHHDAFVTSRSEMVFGRDDILKQIGEYIEKGSDNSIKLIVGEAGFGKSSVMAKAAHETLIKARNNQLLCRGSVPSLPWTVFYHFVGAVPNSTSLIDILRRILKEMQPNEDLPETLEETGGYVKSELLNDYQKPTVIFIDALNQIDKEQKVEPLFWLPEKLSRSVRIVLSMITDSEAHLALKKRKDLSEARLPDLPEDAAMDFVERYLLQYNKKLDAKQLTKLMRKKSSMNPLWLKISCEELRIYGDFGSIDSCITDLNGESLSELLKQVLQRFEKETDSVLLTSTLCLLKVSKSGLLEGELRELLADKEHLEYRVSKRDDDKELRISDKRQLPALEWAAIYRNLRTFLLPFGNPSECRLNFYHSKLGEVVEAMYFEKEKTDRLWWWHKKLADFYSVSRASDRKVEEYPYHLLQLKKYAKSEQEKQRYCKQLEDFIGELETVKRLYEHEFSGTLLQYWRETGDVGYKKMTEHYLNKMSELQDDLSNNLVQLTDRFDEMSRLLVQAGHYKEGMDLAKECLEMIEKLENGVEKDKKLMYIYGQIAHIKSMNQDATVQELDEIIGLHEKAIDYLKKHKLDEKDKKCKRYLALQLIKAAYARGLKAGHYDSMPLSLTHFRTKDGIKKELKERGLKDVKEAIKIYQELKDFGHELEAQLTKATLKRESKEKQLKIYSETLRRCEQLKGVNCPLMGRLCFNMGVVYGRANEHEKAYVCRKQAYIIAKKIYGLNNTKTEKYKGYLLDIAKEAKKRGQDIDVMTDDENKLWKSLTQ